MIDAAQIIGAFFVCFAVGFGFGLLIMAMRRFADRL